MLHLDSNKIGIKALSRGIVCLWTLVDCAISLTKDSLSAMNLFIHSGAERPGVPSYDVYGPQSNEPRIWLYEKIPPGLLS
jgi:hypothetical protein